MHKFYYFMVASSLLFLMACNSPFIPKETGYPVVVFPEKKYILFNPSPSPYQFELPDYVAIDNKVDYFGKSMQKDAWLNIVFSSFNATIYITYTTIRNNNLDTLVRDAFNFANNHSSKATYIEDSSFQTPKGVQGVVFKLGGNVASPYQFFVTDSVKHFLRGALYYNTAPNEDSLRPIHQFIFKDIQRLINSLEWKQ